MKLNRLQSLRPLADVGAVPSLGTLQTTRVSINKRLLSEIDIILYSTNLCLFSMRILRDEIVVPNRSETLKKVTNEVLALYKLLSKKDYMHECNHTKKDIKNFFKSVGLKPKHIRH